MELGTKPGVEHPKTRVMMKRNSFTRHEELADVCAFTPLGVAQSCPQPGIPADERGRDHSLGKPDLRDLRDGLCRDGRRGFGACQ